MARIVCMMIMALCLASLLPQPVHASRLGPNEPLTRANTEALIETALGVADGVGTHDINILVPTLPMANHSKQGATLDLSIRTYDRRSGHLVGDLAVMFDDGRTHRVDVTAIVQELVPLPVPAVSIDPGQIIRTDHLTSIRVRDRSLNGKYLTSADQLIGRQARRRLIAGRPVASRDIRDPSMIEEGEAVTIVYRHGGLMLRTFGEALESGSRGDPIRVRNIESENVIRGIVEAPGVVLVSGSKEPVVVGSGGRRSEAIR